LHAKRPDAGLTARAGRSRTQICRYRCRFVCESGQADTDADFTARAGTERRAFGFCHPTLIISSVWCLCRSLKVLGPTVTSVFEYYIYTTSLVGSQFSNRFRRIWPKQSQGFLFFHSEYGIGQFTSYSSQNRESIISNR